MPPAPHATSKTDRIELARLPGENWGLREKKYSYIIRPMENIRQNKMATAPEGRLLLSMGWPIIVSMLVQALYNIVDSVFVSRLSTLSPEQLTGILGDLYVPGTESTIGDKALNALSTVNPLQMLMISVAVGTAVGMNSLISRRLGEQRIGDANRAAGNGLVVLIISSLFFTKKTKLIYIDSAWILQR